MAMSKFTVDTTLKLFIAKSAVTSFDVKKDLYSDAKEHWISDTIANKFDFPIRTIGGDPVGGGQFAGDLYFLRGGWKIRPDEVDHTLTVNGNLFLDDGETGGLIVPTVGDYTVLVSGVRSNLVLAIETAGTAPEDVWDVELETGFSASRILRILAAVLAGKSSKIGSTRTYRNLIDGLNQTQGTVDGAGNRTYVTYAQ